jgi:putative tricarboxylic transport membrane protein
MEALGGLFTGFNVILTPENLYLCFLGSLIGTLVGVLPGVGPLAALALLLPVTFTLSPVGGMVMLASIFYGAMYGGSTTSILLNIPGEAASVVTCIDGHQMAKQGRAGAALGIAAIGSFVAGTLGVIVMTFFAPAIAAVAIRFGPPENFALMVLGVVCTLFMITGSPVKGALMIALGFLTAAVGIDVVNGRERFTFGSVDLSAGIELLAVVIGLFGVTEVLSNVETLVKSTVVAQRIRGLWPTLADWRASWRPMLRGSGLGFFLGLVPGGGPVTASFMSYALEKRISAHPERFGNGAIEGVAGPEAANNASAAGTLVPLLTLGLPTSATAAIMLAGFQQYGLNPGPLLFTQNPELVWGLVASLFIANTMLLVLNLPLVGLWVRLLAIPQPWLYAGILVFAAMGTVAAKPSVVEVGMLFVFGFLGFLMRRWDYPVAPMVVGLILGPMAEIQLRRAMQMSLGDPMIFLENPVSATLLTLAVIALVAPFVMKGLGRFKASDD